MEQNCGKKTLLLLLHSPPRVQQSFRPPPRNPKSQTGFTYPFFCLPYSRRPKKAYQTMLCPSFFLYLIDSPPLLPENEQTTLKNAKIVALSRFHVWRYPFFRRKKSLSFEDKKVTRISWRPLLLKLQRIETTSMRQKAIQRTHFVPPPPSRTQNCNSEAKTLDERWKRRRHPMPKKRLTPIPTSKHGTDE